jgi:hypothetical protein
MEFDVQSLFQASTLAGGATLVWANLWRSLVFVSPSATRFEVEDGSPDAPIPGWLEPAHEGLTALGFSLAGSWIEQRRLGPTRTCWGYLNEAQRCFAIAADVPLVRTHQRLWTPPEPKSEREGPAARITFLTVSASGGFLLSSNFRRPGATIAGRHLCAGLPGAAADRLFRAHLRRIAELGVAAGTFTLDGLMSHLRDWHSTVGRAELQRQHGVGLLWTVGGLGMVAAPVIGRLWGAT